MVGMMGVGFTVGFAQSHFELGAIAGLMLLAYGFLPVYRRMRLYTLSEYLSRRYNEPCRILYAIIMVLIMVGVQMAPAFYIGSRSLCVLLGGNFLEPAAAAAERRTAAGWFERRDEWRSPPRRRGTSPRPPIR